MTEKKQFKELQFSELLKDEREEGRRTGEDNLLELMNLMEA